MEISVSKTAIINAVKMTVSVIARDEVDAAGNPMYPIMAITSQHEGVVNNLLDAGVGMLCAQVASIVDRTDTADGYTLDLKSDATGADKDVEKFLIDYVVSRWLQMKGSAMADTFIGAANAALLNVRKVLFQRRFQ